MYKTIYVNTSDYLEQFCTLPGLYPLTPETVARHQPDASWMLANAASKIVGRCSLWWSYVPAYPGQRLGLIGHYVAHSRDAATQLLALACAELARPGCTMAVGPMDGNIWRRYRLITERGNQPSFFLEPDNHDDWPTQFSDSGFYPLAHYLSAMNSDLGQRDSRVQNIADHVRHHGIEIRALDPNRFEEELLDIYSVVRVSWCDNFLYSPISASEFMALYLPLRPYIRPELVLIAESQHSRVGFIFAIPDILQRRRCKSVDTVILNTLCVLPKYAGMGLGSLLVARSQEIARALGYRRAIHALMHENNTSRRISAHYSRPIRRYTLFAKRLPCERGGSQEERARAALAIAGG